MRRTLEGAEKWYFLFFRIEEETAERGSISKVNERKPNRRKRMKEEKGQGEQKKKSEEKNKSTPSSYRHPLQSTRIETYSYSFKGSFPDWNREALLQSMTVYSVRMT